LTTLYRWATCRWFSCPWSVSEWTVSTSGTWHRLFSGSFWSTPLSVVLRLTIMLLWAYLVSYVPKISEFNVIRLFFPIYDKCFRSTIRRTGYFMGDDCRTHCLAAYNEILASVLLWSSVIQSLIWKYREIVCKIVQKISIFLSQLIHSICVFAGRNLVQCLVFYATLHQCLRFDLQWVAPAVPDAFRHFVVKIWLFFPRAGFFPHILFNKGFSDDSQGSTQAGLLCCAAWGLALSAWFSDKTMCSFWEDMRRNLMFFA